MISIPQSSMEELLRQDHPYWTDQAIEVEAAKLTANLDPRFENPLLKYIKGKKTDVECGDYSISAICLMRQCSYLEALTLLDEYIKDPAKGKALILRR